MSFYFGVQVPFLRDMYHLHRYEFEKHAKRMLAIIVTTLTSLFINFVFELVILYTELCAQNTFFNEVQAAFFDPTNVEPGMCAAFSFYYSHRLR